MILLKSILAFKRDTTGASMVEFALSLPLLVTISLGIYETTNYILLSNKLNEIASGLANWISAQTNTANITDCLTGANLMGTDYAFSTKGGVVVSGLQQVLPTTVQQVVWKQASSGATSQISTVPLTGVVTSAPFSIASEPNLIVVEVSYAYQPTFTYFLGVFPSIKLWRVAQAVPRGSSQFNPLAAS